MSEATNRALGGAEASFAIARVSFRRVLRGRAIVVVGVMSLLPLLLAVQMKVADAKPEDAWVALVEIWAYLVAILSPIMLGSSIGEEIEERTANYLWSRPLPRWSIIGGKLLALVPLVWVLMTIAMLLPGLVFYQDQMQANLGHLLAAAALGVTAAAAVTAGITALTPRRGALLSLAYLLFIDRTLGWSSASIAKISIAYHTLNLAGVHDAGQSVAMSIVGLVALSTVWIGLAVWRIRRME